MAKKSMIAKAPPSSKCAGLIVVEFAGVPVATCAVSKCAVYASGNMLVKGRFQE